MKRKLLILISSLALIAPSLAWAQPGIPHQFYGTVNYTNGAAPDGLLVEAKVDGAVVGKALTYNGKYGYSPSLLFAKISDGEWNGQTAHFFVDGIDTGETYALSRGGYTNLPLTVPSSLKQDSGGGGGGSGGGGGGGGGGSSAPPGTTTGDSNGDGKVNKYDFALMMSDWGKTGTTASDLNRDGVVNKYDFSLLMANWSAS